MKDIEELIHKLLEVIDYDGNIEKFTSKFLNSVHKQAFSNLVDTLNSSKKEEVLEFLTNLNNNDSEEISKHLGKYFSKEQVIKAMEDASKYGTALILDSVKDSLNKKQRSLIEDLVK